MLPTQLQRHAQIKFHSIPILCLLQNELEPSVVTICARPDAILGHARVPGLRVVHYCLGIYTVGVFSSSRVRCSIIFIAHLTT